MVPEPSITPAGGRRPGQRIAFVLHGFGGGGMERSMLRLAEGLIARGFGVDFVVAEAKGELAGEVPPSARIIELDRVRLWRARARGFAADPGAWRAAAATQEQDQPPEAADPAIAIHGRLLPARPTRRGAGRRTAI